MHPHRASIRTDEGDGQVAHEAVLEIDEEVLEVISRGDDLTGVECREDDGRAEALCLVVRDEETTAEVHIGRAVVGDAFRNADDRIFLTRTDLQVLGGALEAGGGGDENQVVHEIAVGTVVVVHDEQLHSVGPGGIVAVGDLRTAVVGCAVIKIPFPRSDEKVLRGL